MRLINYISIRQNALLEKVGIIINDKEYTQKELEEMEDIIVKHIREKCIDKNDETTSEGKEFEDLVDIITDFEYENDPEKVTLNDQLKEDDYVELKNGKRGILIDITNEMYTIELDEEFKTGDIAEDIQIISIFEIKRIIPKE